MSVRELTEALWNEPCDSSRAGALRTHIWALRQLIAPAQRLAKDVVGYLVRVHPGELDLEAFRGLALAGRHALATGDFRLAEASFDQALRLWSEPSLADLPATPAGDLSALKLTGERDAIVELLTDVRMALGQHRDLLPELQAQVIAEPENEYRWAQLLLALYRSDQQVRALAAYSRAREILVAEYGVDPGPKLRRLHDQILRSDPALDLPQ
jgi:DNA-binding SARP family transcriptional activator